MENSKIWIKTIKLCILTYPVNVGRQLEDVDFVDNVELMEPIGKVRLVACQLRYVP
jgi:hypothetical protein